MYRKSIYLSKFVVSLLFAGLLVFNWGPISAESQCQGLSKGQCESDSDCTWVSGYSKQDGTNVNAYCRAKPGKASGESHAVKKTKKDKEEDSDEHESKKKSKKDKDEDVKESKKAKKEKDKEDEDDSKKKSKKSKKDKDEDDDKESKKEKKSKKSKKDDDDDSKKSKKSKKKKKDD
ncbi:hypothetical protein EHQ53_05450 [Leptospira langatensis]|uniref:Uncharacterized protein n=1 Tax=Leptospira langatensis TaxID=2484983 RepID=A0A5F1ZV05_9LEPT|nr:hypothetical protein [Leptospira langatensis]TGK02913.1 hypothetical protein EHO57_06285 [Leptospira langatensis]TGL41668.1 hypothetical protein EHQ53_05450 [Leptospira langatensis]